MPKRTSKRNPKTTKSRPAKSSAAVVVNLSQIAKSFGVTRKTVRAWKQSGCPLAGGNDAIRQWVADREQKKRETKKTEGGSREIDRKRALEVEITRLKLQRAQGEVVEVKSVQEELERLCEQLKVHSATMVDEIAAKMRAKGDDRQMMRAARDLFLRRVAQAMEAARGNAVSDSSKN